ncbi:uncharacterized protein LOC135486514 [Lineus longissimus]|uniref:uncharacterized protein LOC135486514 n=1 Tax=Lineus longissimus TaxID=88925 RepID=UPI00315CD21C
MSPLFLIVLILPGLAWSRSIAFENQVDDYFRPEQTHEPTPAPDALKDQETTPVPHGLGLVKDQEKSTPVPDGSGHVKDQEDSAPVPHGSGHVKDQEESTSVPDGLGPVKDQEKSTPVPDGSGHVKDQEESTSVPDGLGPVKDQEKSTPVPDGSGPDQEEPTPVPDDSGPVKDQEESAPVPDGSGPVKDQDESAPIPDGLGPVKDQDESTPIPDDLGPVKDQEELAPVPDRSGPVKDQEKPTPIPIGLGPVKDQDESTPVPDDLGPVKDQEELAPVLDSSAPVKDQEEPTPVPDSSGPVKDQDESTPVPDDLGPVKDQEELAPVPDRSGPVKDQEEPTPVPDRSGPVKDQDESTPVPDSFGPVDHQQPSTDFEGFRPLNEALEDIPVLEVEWDAVQGFGDPEESLGGFEGDILLTVEQKEALLERASGRSRRNAVTDLTNKWPNNELIYEISQHVREDNRATVLKAMEYINFLTADCVRFVPFSGDVKVHPNRVYIQNSMFSCASYIGRIPSLEKQELVLAPGLCYNQMGRVMHEFIHALGFWHEHSRADRDDWIFVNETAIRKGAESNFIKNSPSQIDHLDTKYDYNSVMHYKATAFAADYHNPTITQLHDTDKYTIGQRDYLSAKDLIKIRRFYGCE